MDLTLATREVDGRAVVAVGGEIDVYTAPKLRDKISELVGEGHHQLLIDMAAVDFLDSTGLGVLVGRLKAVRMLEGVMRVVITNPRVLRNFQITGLEKIFTIDSTAADAVAAVKAGA